MKNCCTGDDRVVEGFTCMIEESARAQGIYESAENLGQGRLEEQREICVKLLDQTTDTKTVFDAWDKGLNIADGERGLKIMTWAMIGALILSAILAAFVALSIKRRLTGPLNHVIATLNVDAEELAAVSGELSRTSAALSDGAANQAASLEESAAAIEELSSMTSRNAESSKQANTLMTENSGRVENGCQTVERMAEAMKAVSQSSQAIGNIIKAIEEFFGQLRISTKEVGDMIRDIDEATGEQAQGMHQISQSMSLIDHVAQEAMTNAQNAAQASDALNHRSVNLAEAVEDLGRIIGWPARSGRTSADGPGRSRNRASLKRLEIMIRNK